jgi:hypothetical protein
MPESAGLAAPGTDRERLAYLRSIPPVPGRQAEVDRNLWLGFRNAQQARDAYQEQMDAYELKIREQAPDAAALTVNGRKVAVRVTQNVESASWRKDFYRRLPGDRKETA